MGAAAPRRSRGCVAPSLGTAPRHFTAGVGTTITMKAVTLAGGLGSRLSEETVVRPKPTLWHIMKLHSAHGINEFVICLGYKGYLIKEYFANYHLHACDVTFVLAAGTTEVQRSETEPWRVTLIDRRLGPAGRARREAAPGAGAWRARCRGSAP